MKRLRIATLPLFAVALLLVALASISEVRPARAATGDLVGSVTFSQDCASGLGVGLTFDGTNLWYSCYGSTTDLYKANPATGAVIASYNVVGGLGALAWDSGRGMLWAGAGCAPGQIGSEVYLIDPSTGVATLQFNAASPNCVDDGLAYDRTNDTIYFSPDGVTNIQHLSATGVPKPDDGFAWGGTGCPANPSGQNSGVAIGGDLLYEGADGCNHVWVVNKVSKTAAFDFSTVTAGDPNFRDEALTCDTNTFAALGKHVMWSKEAYSPMRAHAFEIPVGSCGVGGQAAGPPITKSPALANLWLCQPVGTCTDPSDGIGESDFDVRLDQPVASNSPKGEAQTVGSFQFEVRYDRKLVNVSVTPGGLFLVDSTLRSDISCATISGQGFVQFRCNVKGKTGTPITGPGVLAVVHVTPTADVYSMIIPSQDNGIATQLINQGCDLGDLQGHPIATTVCSDADVTLRYLEGDVNGDCSVDVRDQQEVAFRWGSHTGQLLYNSRFDLEPSAPKLGDGNIDAKDIQVVYGRHGSTCSEPHPAQLPVNPKAFPPAPTPLSPPV